MAHPIQRLVTASLAGLALCLAITLPSIQALPSHMVTRVYFTDPEMTDEIGVQIVLHCNGGSGPVWGMVGDWAQETKDACREQIQYEAICYRYYWACTNQSDPSTCYQTAPRQSISCP